MYLYEYTIVKMCEQVGHFCLIICTSFIVEMKKPKYWQNFHVLQNTWSYKKLVQYCKFFIPCDHTVGTCRKPQQIFFHKYCTSVTLPCHSGTCSVLSGDVSSLTRYHTPRWKYHKNRRGGNFTCKIFDLKYGTRQNCHCPSSNHIN